MFSRLDPSFVYTDVSSDITEHDLDIVADTWEMDGREVYQGVRDDRYTHASVFWLYDDNLERVGCAEHSKNDHADMRVLWFRDSEFGTLLQEDWIVGEDIWSKLPRHVFDRFLNEGWTTPRKVLEHCLRGSVRIVTLDMIRTLPMVYTCSDCGRRSLDNPSTCTTTASALDFPEREKVFFVDNDCLVHSPSPDSCVWSMLQPRRVDDSLLVLEEQPSESQQTEPRSLPRDPSPPPLDSQPRGE